MGSTDGLILQRMSLYYNGCFDDKTDGINGWADTITMDGLILQQMG
jgi:hypothetical protein